MRLYIPTLGRPNSQKTLGRLPEGTKERVWFVIHESEREHFPKERSVVMTQLGAPKFRQAALDHAHADGEFKIFMFDDDLRFTMRTENWTKDNPETRVMSHHDIRRGLDKIDEALDSFAMAGWGARGGNHGLSPKDHTLNARIMRAFGVRVDIMKELDIRFDKYEYWEDFHVNLSFLRRGYQTYVSLIYLNDGITNSEGGCSVYRTTPTLLECRKRFLEEHGAFCEAVDKTAEAWKNWDSNIAPDMRVAWKKAFEARDLCTM